MSDEPTDQKVVAGPRGEPQLLQALVAHWIHEDNLYWTQMRHLLLLQLAIFAAWYGLDLVLAALVMLVSIGVSWLLLDLANTISGNRDANLNAIRILSIAIATPETEKTLKPLLNGDYEKWGLFRFARHSLEPKKDAGKRFQRIVFVGCIIIDGVALFATAHDLVVARQDGSLQKVRPSRSQRTTSGSNAPNYYGAPAGACLGDAVRGLKSLYI